MNTIGRETLNEPEFPLSYFEANDCFFYLIIFNLFFISGVYGLKKEENGIHPCLALKHATRYEKNVADTALASNLREISSRNKCNPANMMEFQISDGDIPNSFFPVFSIEA